MKTIGVSPWALTLLFSLLSISVRSQPADDFNPGADNGVTSLLLQPDGKVLVGGRFRTLAGVARKTFGRVNADGTADLSFDPALSVWAFAAQPDGNVLVAGAIDRPVGYAYSSVFSRINPDSSQTRLVPAPGYVGSLWLQADGNILIAGLFVLGGSNYTSIARLNADLSVDTAFNPYPSMDTGMDNNPDTNPSVSLVAEQTDRKILVAGNFLYLAGQNRTNFGRLLPDGTLDPTFNPQVANITVLALQPDGKIVVGGYPNLTGPQSPACLARLNADGALDTNFNLQISGSVLTVALQTDGRLLVGGTLSTINGQKLPNLVRISTDGTLDSSFNPGLDSLADVSSIALQPDGKIVVGGGFSMLGGQPRQFIGRLNNTEPATQRLSLNGSTLTWMRGGTSPEVIRTSFDFSSDGGISWNHIGDGARISGGWELTGVSIPTNSNLRARGFTGDSFVETIIGPPFLLEGPQSRTNAAGSSAEFNVYAGGSGLGYQWLKNGTNLMDGGNVSGSLTRYLSLTNVLGADAGAYTVLITNAFGSLTSGVAVLTVADPVIQVQPLSQIRQAGESATFTVVPIGTAPFVYQWRKEGSPVPGATASSFTISNLVDLDAAAYDVVVTSRWGSNASQSALLTINQVQADSFAPLLLEPWGPGVNALALQPDSKIILAGGFESVDAQPRTNLARLNPDGSLDASFNPRAFTNFANGAALEALALLPDRKILVGGVFNSVAGQNRTNLARLNPDGTLDQSFTCNLSRNSAWSYGGVSSLLVQPDGKVLVGGLFEVSGNTNIVRLNPDGSLDASFTPGRYHALPDSNIQVNPVQTIALQSDGKILLGGAFTIGGSYDQDFSYLVRLEPNGEPDTNFNTTVDLNQLLPEQGGYINSLLVQPDGKIVVGGVFSWLAGDFRNNLARLNADGTLDTAFNPGADLWGVTSIALQGDGKLILAGTFDSVGGQSRTNLARLNPDGTVDPAFNPASDSAYPYAGVALQTDGKILVCGSFRTVAGQDRTAVGRLTNPGEPTQELSYDGSVITWSSGGTSPQFWATTFEYSIDGSSWTTLGTGVHTANGWQFSDVSLPGNSIIRARGYINGGPYNASSWFLEAVRSPALAITDFKFLPQGQTQFTALGPPGQSAVIDTSSDLKTWSARSTNTLVNGFFTFSESQPLGSSNRFYRLHQ